MVVKRLPFRCSACEETILAPESLAGVTQACPRCRQHVAWELPKHTSESQSRSLPAFKAVCGGILIVFGLWVFLNALASDKPRTNSQVLGVLIWGGLSMIGGAGLIASYRTEELSRKVKSLNPISGKPRAVVLRRLGSSTVSVREGGDEFVTWSSPGYAITLQFRDDACVGVVREVTTDY